MVWRGVASHDVMRLQPGLATYQDLVKGRVHVGYTDIDKAALDVVHSDLERARELHKPCDPLACLKMMQQRRAHYALLMSSAVMEYLIPRYFLVRVRQCPWGCDTSGWSKIKTKNDAACLLPLVPTFFLKKKCRPN